MSAQPASEKSNSGLPYQPLAFGKYTLLDRIAIGGMAEVFAAKSYGVEGFVKPLAIKRILPTVSEDSEFVSMFIDEARVSGHLSHANICPIYELGRIGVSYYIAMEFIWGKDLLQIINRFRRLGLRMPPEMAAWIAAQALEGLDYAHKKRDADGVELNIVHRDVSPQNILVSYEGVVKLIDFGIAKAATRTTKTNAGILKGKSGYMSPEQVRGFVIDHRSDLFAMGTCLYEMLSCERLFKAETEFATLERVRNAEAMPLGQKVQGIPPQLETIVHKALKADRLERWQTGAEFSAALRQFLSGNFPEYGQRDVTQWMKEAFADDLKQEARRRQSFVHSEPIEEPTAKSMPQHIDLSGEATVIAETGAFHDHDPNSEQIYFRSESAQMSLLQDMTQIASEPTVLLSATEYENIASAGFSPSGEASSWSLGNVPIPVRTTHIVEFDSSNQVPWFLLGILLGSLGFLVSFIFSQS